MGWDEREAAARLVSVLVDTEVAALETPHVVVCRNVRLGVETISGPYDSGFAALVAAEQMLLEEDSDDGDVLAVRVAQLCPPVSEGRHG